MPRSHVVIDDFFSPADLVKVWNDVLRLEGSMKVGLMGTQRNRYADEKKNRVAIVDEQFKLDGVFPCLLPITQRTIWSHTLLDALEDLEGGIFQLLRYCITRSLQVSAYGNGDFYRQHKDLSPVPNLTIVIFLCGEPKPFIGGNFVLEFRSRQKRIEFKNNRCLIFPSNTLHEVTAVHARSNRFEDRRFSLQVCPTHGKNSKLFDPARGVQPPDLNTPDFAVYENEWEQFGRLLSLLHYNQPWKGNFEALLYQSEMAVGTLTRNLKYLARHFFESQRPSIQTQISAKELRISAKVLIDGEPYSFGYAVSLEPPQHLRMYCRGTEEHSAVVSPQAAAESCIQLLDGLLRKVAAGSPETLMKPTHVGEAAHAR